MGITIFMPAGDMTLTPLSPSTGIIGVPAGDMILVALTPSAVWSIPEAATVQRIYRCMLTGSEDSLPDLELPLASFTARVREGDPSYLSCRIPNGSAYEDAILGRPNGDIVVKYGVRLPTGEEQLVEIVRVDYESAQVERTGALDNIILTGHKTITTGASKEWPVSGVSYFAVGADGKRSIRADVDFFLRCGDICQYDGDVMEVGAITYSVAANPTQAVMEVTEA